MDTNQANNASPSGSQMVTASSSPVSPVEAKAPVKKRLKQEALDMLEDHFQKVSQSPSLIEKEALLEKIKVHGGVNVDGMLRPNDSTIQALPGCGDYDVTRMTGWFGSRRHRLRRKERAPVAGPVHNDNNNSRFPSLTQATIQHLTILASNQHNPSPELLKTWATLLASSGAKEQDVANWVHYRNQEEQFQHLPTPSDTMTPEPSASLSPTQSTFPPLYKQETMTSPVMPALQLHPPKLARATPSESSPTKLLPTSNNDPMLQPPQITPLQAIIRGVCDALANPQTTPNPPPKTAAEFEAMFAPFEQRLSLLLHALDSTT